MVSRLTCQTMYATVCYMEHKYMPGPWRLGQPLGRKEDGKWINEPAYSVFANDEIKGFQGPSSLGTFNFSDACLIAAAPELLEALEGVIHILERAQKNAADAAAFPSIKLARAAIRKAKGI